MFKRMLIVLIMLSMIMLSGITMAGEEAAEKTIELSLEECVNMAFENNPDMKLARTSLEKADVEYDRMKRQYDRYEDAKKLDLMYGLNTYDYKLQMETGLRAAEMGLTLAREGLKNARLGIRLAVESAYYGALQAQDEVVINKASLERAREQLRISELEFEAGRVARRDVLDAEAAVARAQAAYNASLRSKDIAYMKLKQVVNLPLDTPIKLSSKFDYVLLKEIDLEGDIAHALENKFEVIQAREELAVAQKAFEVAEAFYAPNVYEYRIKKHELQLAEIALGKEVKAAEVEIREAYYNMKSAEESIPALEKSLAAAKESLRLARLQYKAGLIRSIDVMTVENSVKELELEISRAIHNYNLAKAQYFKAVGREQGRQ